MKELNIFQKKVTAHNLVSDELLVLLRRLYASSYAVQFEFILCKEIPKIKTIILL